MLWLSPEELVGLTKFRQSQKQHEALNQMGVNHVVRPDGSLVVFQADLTSGKSKEVRFVIDG